MMDGVASVLFTPIVINGREVQNRLAVAPARAGAVEDPPLRDQRARQRDVRQEREWER